MHPDVLSVEAPNSPVDAQPRGNSLSAVAVEGNHTANYRGCVKWKEAKAALVRQEPERDQKSVAKGESDSHEAQRAGSSAEQMDLGEG